MKIKIGKYKNWIGPYQVADAIFFWHDRYPSEKLAKRWDYKLYDKVAWFLSHGFYPESKAEKFSIGEKIPKTWFYKLLLWIDSKKERTIKIHIDKWDTWNMDSTLALIILPMLKQLKATKQGSGMIDLEDVPEHLRATTTEEYDSQFTFEFYNEDVPRGVDVHTRYEWFLNELIWTFEQLQPDCDWEEQYRSGNIEMHSEPCKWDENGDPTLYHLKRGPNDTYKVDYDKLQKHQDRIDNGLRLFGKYFLTLWD